MRTAKQRAYAALKECLANLDKERAQIVDAIRTLEPARPVAQGLEVDPKAFMDALAPSTPDEPEPEKKYGKGETSPLQNAIINLLSTCENHPRWHSPRNIAAVLENSKLNHSKSFALFAITVAGACQRLLKRGLIERMGVRNRPEYRLPQEVTRTRIRVKITPLKAERRKRKYVPPTFKHGEFKALVLKEFQTCSLWLSAPTIAGRLCDKNRDERLNGRNMKFLCQQVAGAAAALFRDGKLDRSHTGRPRRYRVAEKHKRC